MALRVNNPGAMLSALGDLPGARAVRTAVARASAIFSRKLRRTSLGGNGVDGKRRAPRRTRPGEGALSPGTEIQIPKQKKAEAIAGLRLFLLTAASRLELEAGAELNLAFAVKRTACFGKCAEGGLIVQRRSS